MRAASYAELEDIYLDKYDYNERKENIIKTGGWMDGWMDGKITDKILCYT